MMFNPEKCREALNKSKLDFYKCIMLEVEFLKPAFHMIEADVLIYTFPSLSVVYNTFKEKDINGFFNYIREMRKENFIYTFFSNSPILKNRIEPNEFLLIFSTDHKKMNAEDLAHFTESDIDEFVKSRWN